MKKVLLAICLSFGFLLPANAQRISSPASNPNSSEALPSYPGGNAALENFMLQNVDFSRIKERGTVVVYFMVDQAGLASDYRILTSLNERVDAVVMDAVKKINRWVPGKLASNPQIMGHRVEVTF